MAGPEQVTSTAAADPPTSCTCTETVLCDACALSQIEALNASNNADCVELLPGALSPREQIGVHAAVTGLLARLEGSF